MNRMRGLILVAFISVVAFSFLKLYSPKDTTDPGIGPIQSTRLNLRKPPTIQHSEPFTAPNSVAGNSDGKSVESTKRQRQEVKFKLYVINHLNNLLPDASVKALPIQVADASQMVTTSRENKHFTLSDIHPGILYSLSVSHRGYDLFSTRTVLYDLDPLTVIMSPYKAESCFIEVRDAMTMELTSATIYAEYSMPLIPEITALDNAVGTFEAHNINWGDSVRLYVKPEEPYLSRIVHLETHDGEPGDVFTLTVLKPGYIAGRAVDALSGEPIAGAGVYQETDKCTTMTDSQGRFRVMQQDQSRLFIRKAQLESESVMLPQFHFRTFDAGDIKLYHEIPLAVNVVDEYGRGVAGKEVWIASGDTRPFANVTSGITDSIGTFYTTCYSNHVVKARIPDQPLLFTDQPSSASAVSRSITLSLGSAEVTGAVTKYGIPFDAGVRIQAEDKQFDYAPDAAQLGNFRFSNLPAGSYILTAREWNRHGTSLPTTTSVRLLPGQSLEKYIELTDPIKNTTRRFIEYEIVDKNRHLLHDAEVSFRESSGRQVPGELFPTPGGGLHVVRFPGVIYATARHPLHGFSEVVKIPPVDSPGPHETKISLQLDMVGVPVTVTMLSDIDGLPIEGATATIYSGNLPLNYFVKSSSDGTLITKNVPTGDYLISLNHIGYVSKQIPVTVSDKPVSLIEVLEVDRETVKLLHR